MNFVSCVRWVKKGFAEEKPIQVNLNRQELEAIVRECTTAEVEEKNEDDELNGANSDVDMEDEYAFKNYDDENDKQPTQSALGIENIVDFSSPVSKDSNNSDSGVGNSSGGDTSAGAVNNSNTNNDNNDDNDNDSDATDDLILQDDNLILVAHVEEDASVLNVYVYNQDKEYMYVHHYYLLPSLPLCLEWLSFDPASPKTGNLVAIGGMTPEIDVWDLDIINGIEPAFKLGKHTKNKKYKHRNHGHTDAVLDIAWNKNLQHIMASGSVDETVLLWDIETRKASTRFREFKDKVQSLKWHPTEHQILLAGSSDKTVKIFDCRLENTSNTWEVNGEVEKVIWDPVVQYQALVGTDTGFVYCIDCRSKEFLWQLPAHDKEVTGIGFCDTSPGCMVTCSMDGLLKKWDISNNEPKILRTKALAVDEIQGLDISPDNPCLVAIAGTKKDNNFLVVDLSLD